jgi:hypothetical protein
MQPEQVLGDLNGHLPPASDATRARRMSWDSAAALVRHAPTGALATLVVHSVVDESNPNDSIESGPDRYIRLTSVLK